MLSLAVRLAVGCVWAFSSLVASAQALPLSRFDLNVDGVVSSLDAFELRKCYGKPVACDPRADFDNDGTIGVKDLSLLAANYGRKVPPASPLPATSLVVSVSKSIVKPGEAFTLRAELRGLPDPAPLVRWYFPDNVVAQGAVVTRSLTTVALTPIDVTVQLGDGRLLQSSTIITVTDANGKTPALLGLPDRMGDVDGSGSVTLIDAYRVYRQLAGLSTLDRTARDIADFDRDGKLTNADARNVALAAISGSPYVESLSPERLLPGTIVTLRSAALVNPAAELTIRVAGSSVVQRPQSLVPGMATFLIPFDVPLTGSFTPSTVIVLDGAIEKARFPVRVAAPPAPVANPQALVVELFRLIGSSLTSNTARVAERALAAGLSATDQEVMKAFALSGERQGLVAIDGLIKILNGPGGQASARLIAATLQANGFDDLNALLSELRAGGTSPAATLQKQSLKTLLGVQAASSTGSELCDLTMQSYCPVRIAAKSLSTASNVTQFACAALLGVGVGVVIAPEPYLDLPTVSAWIGLCSGVQAQIETASTVADLLGAVDAELTLTGAPTRLSVGDTAKLVARLNVGGVDDICQLAGVIGGQKASDAVAKKIVDRVILRLLDKNIGVQLVKKSAELLGGFEYVENFVRTLRGAATMALTKGTIDQAINAAANALCPSGGLCNPNIDTRSALSSNANLVFPQQDRSAQFICPVRFPGDPSSYKFAAKKDVCGDTLKSPDVEITCGGKMVTITMGDNGSALDDIYEVVIDDNFILTSSNPQRVVTGTFELSVGVYTVRMYGRAAPDGIGTYYISFSGARLISGDPTSGSDLTPGAVKTFQIEVQ